MINELNATDSPLGRWLASGQTARICGLNLRPVPHPHLPTMPQCIMKGQACVYFLEQMPQGHTLLLKVFTAGRRPTDDYLSRVDQCLPGTLPFFTGTQRRLLKGEHLDRWASAYKDAALGDLIEGAILMPKVPGMPWASMADALREHELEMSPI